MVLYLDDPARWKTKMLLGVLPLALELEETSFVFCFSLWIWSWTPAFTCSTLEASPFRKQENKIPCCAVL